MKNLRILVLTKRQYLGRDLLNDRYWRVFEIPEQLSALGHEVRGVTLSYRSRPQGRFRPGKVTWQSINGMPLTPCGWFRHTACVAETIRSFKPDVVWASSDAWHAVVVWKVCSKHHIPYVVDLYDNYESFGLSRFPGLIGLMRQSCRNAAALTVVSRTLRGYVREYYRLRHIPVQVLGNAIDSELFFPRPKAKARELLGLPANGILFGTAGALHANRGIDVLFRASQIVARKYPDCSLVVAGPRDNTLKKYAAPHIIDLGVLSPSQVPLLLSALDVAVICNKNSSFGRYCYPQKFHEIVACGTPLVAADVGEISYLLKSFPGSLFPFDSAEALAQRIEAQINDPVLVKTEREPTWLDRSQTLSAVLNNAVVG